MAEVFRYSYLSEEQVRGFDNYKYSSMDTSPVAVYISHPFWNQVVKLVPDFVAPNVLTFSGFLLVMWSFLLTSYFDYYLLASSDGIAGYSAVPNWVWLILCIFNFAAHVLDGIDGKQARKIGASGPTGELFDHGIDSWLTLPFVVCAFSVIGRGGIHSISTFYLLLILISVQLVFIATHWEKYNTGILYLSWCYDLGQYILSLFYLVTFLEGGHKFWQFRVPIVNLSTPEVILLVCFLGCFGMSLPMSLYNIYLSYRDKTGKMRSFYESVLPLFSSAVLFTAAIIWGLYSPYDILNRDPRIFMWTMGTIFSNIACRLIISQMTNTRCEVFNLLLAPYVAVALGFLVMRNPTIVELHCVYGLALLATVAHVHYAICVVNQMCEHFNIRCFVVKRKAAE